jgi:hypothetical protein
MNNKEYMVIRIKNNRDQELTDKNTYDHVVRLLKNVFLAREEF